MTKGKKSLKVLWFPLGKMSLVKQRVYFSFFVSNRLRGDPAFPGEYLCFSESKHYKSMRRKDPGDGQSGLKTVWYVTHVLQFCHP